MRSRRKSLSILVLAVCVVLRARQSCECPVWVPPYGLWDWQLAGSGPGYQSAGRLYNPGYSRPQTTTNYQPLINAITLLPGWYGQGPITRTTGFILTRAGRMRVRRRQARRTRVPCTRAARTLRRSTTTARSSAQHDPGRSATAGLRHAAEAAVKDAVHESKTTGHGSVKLVVDAKNKLSAYEDKVLPAVRAKNSTDGAALENFFVDLDSALDAMTYVF